MSIKDNTAENKAIADQANEIMCDCTGTKRGKIQSLFEDGFDLESICSKTGITTGCGGCEWEVDLLLDELYEQIKE